MQCAFEGSFHHSILGNKRELKTRTAGPRVNLADLISRSIIGIRNVQIRRFGVKVKASTNKCFIELPLIFLFCAHLILLGLVEVYQNECSELLYPEARVIWTGDSSKYCVILGMMQQFVGQYFSGMIKPLLP